MKPVTVSRRLPGPLTLLAVTFLTGCATRPAVMGYYTKPSQEPSFELVDRRPDNERTTGWLSNFSRSCYYTVRQYGDEATSPDRLTLLRDNLDSMLHKELTGKRLVVIHYGIYINALHRSPRGLSIGGGDPLVGALINRAFSNRTDNHCMAAEMTEPRLAADDETAPAPPVIVEITLSLDGKTHSVRSIYTPNWDIPVEQPNNHDTAAAIFAAIRKATSQLTAQMVAN
jgi:hypothetical protein